MKAILLSLAALAALLSLACSNHKVTSTAVRRYPIEGDILKMNPGDQTATIKHLAIAGWMSAMTMDYSIPSKTDYAKVHVGDHIKATVFVQDEEFWVGDIQDSQSVK
jgi:Cu/Ag efflux protein CusF